MNKLEKKPAFHSSIQNATTKICLLLISHHNFLTRLLDARYIYKSPFNQPLTPDFSLYFFVFVFAGNANVTWRANESTHLTNTLFLL